MAKALGDLVISVATDLGPMKTGLGKIPALLGSVLKGGAFETGKNAVEAIFGTPKDIIAESVQLAASWERSSTEIEVFLGSAGKAQSLMGDLRKFASESPLKLSETVAEAKKLLASGIGQGQLIPTMEMLSDLSVGNQHTLHALTKAYTDVIAAGRLYGTELRQFTETGIPLVEELAKVLGKPKEEIRHLMEAGRIGSGDMQKALKSLTAEGGRFHKMTARGAQTLEGQFERLRDGVEELKREFGRAIIEEAGLKDAVRDGSKFADDMKRFIGDLRPGIRFVADTIKGVAQVVGELVRHGPLFAAAFGKAIGAISPRVGELLGQIAAAVKSLADFKLDPHAVVDFAFMVASTFASLFESVLGSLADGLEAIYEERIKPIVDDLRTAAQAWLDVKAFLDGGAKATAEFAEQLKVTGDRLGGKMPEREAFVKGRQDDFKNIDDAHLAARRGLMNAGNRPEDLKELARLRDEVKAAVSLLADQEFTAKWSGNPGERRNAGEAADSVIKDILVPRMKRFALAVDSANPVPADPRLPAAPLKFGKSDVREIGPAVDVRPFLGPFVESQLAKLSDLGKLTDRLLEKAPKLTDGDRDRLARLPEAEMKAEVERLFGPSSRALGEIASATEDVRRSQQERAEAAYEARYGATAEKRLAGEQRLAQASKSLDARFADLKGTAERAGVSLEGVLLASPALDLLAAKTVAAGGRLKGFQFGIAKALEDMRADIHKSLSASGKGSDPAKDAMDMLAGAAFGAASGLQQVKKATVEIDQFGVFRAKLVEMQGITARIPQRFADEWNQLREMRDLGREGKLKDGFGNNMFDERKFNLAAADLFKKYQPNIPEVKLPTAAEFGSQQVAEMYARANSFGGASTADLLQRMLAVEQQQLAEAKRQTDAFLNNQPKVIHLPPL